MAVVQISRIQVRRGKANSGTGIPQLASGELAWALDTQELYIGNGAVAEGAPAVGNTKVLTELDLSANGNVLNLIQHIYKVNTPGIQTGPTPNAPVARTLQDRFDDRVTASNFGAVGDGVTDDTAALQRAIDQLFLNDTISKSSVDTPDGISTRVTLTIPAGKYLITDTLYVPSYTSLIGAGADKTIFYYTGTGPVIEFVNDNSDPGAPDSLGNTLGNTQPRQIILSDLTLYTDTFNQPGIVLNAVRDSLFNNMIIKGAWGGTFSSDSKGIVMNAVSALVTTERNVFNNIVISGFSHAVYSKQDILGNTFNNCYLTDCRQGFVLGVNAAGNTVGEQYGPRKTLIRNCRFEDIKRQAVYVGLGLGNTVKDSNFINVGNDGGGNLTAEFPQVFFDSHGNTVENTQSDRVTDLANPTVGYISVPYVPEVAGHGTYSSFGTRQRTLQGNPINNYSTLFRLPVSTDSLGNPWRNIDYVIDYIYRSTSNNFSRRGTLKLIADIDNSTWQLSDEHDISGISEEDSLKLDLRVSLLNQAGTTLLPDEIPYSIAVEYKNTLPSDAGYFIYSYKSSF